MGEGTGEDEKPPPVTGGVVEYRRIVEADRASAVPGEAAGRVRIEMDGGLVGLEVVLDRDGALDRWRADEAVAWLIARLDPPRRATDVLKVRRLVVAQQLRQRDQHQAGREHHLDGTPAQRADAESRKQAEGRNHDHEVAIAEEVQVEARLRQGEGEDDRQDK